MTPPLTLFSPLAETLPSPSTCQQRFSKSHTLTNSQLPPASQTDTMGGRHTAVKPIQVDVAVTAINLLPLFLTRPPCAPFGEKIPVTNSDSNPHQSLHFSEGQAYAGLSWNYLPKALSSIRIASPNLLRRRLMPTIRISAT